MDWEKFADKKRKSHSLEDFFHDLGNKPASLLKIILVGVVVITLMTTFYTVEPEEEAVVTRFGKYISTSPPGLHFKIPFGIDRISKLKTSTHLQESFGFTGEGTYRGYRRNVRRNLKEESLMLTGDLNVADVEWVVHYQIADPRKYLFNIRDPQKNIRDISQAVMRRVVGDRTVNDVLTVGRTEIAHDAKLLMQEILDAYQMGVRVATLKLQDVNPPEPVQPSFNEVNAAKQEQEKAINRAEAKYNQTIPAARGKAEREVSSSQGYATALVNRAKGDAEKFLSVLGEYRKAPEVTRTRLYLEAIESLLARIDGLTIIDPQVKGVLPIFDGMGGSTGRAMPDFRSAQKPGQSIVESRRNP